MADLDEVPGGVRDERPGPKLWARTRNNNPNPNSEIVQRFVDQSRRLNDMAGSILRSAGVRALPGKIASLDFDGTDHGDLGSAGWVLGSDEGGPSYLGLNGIDVYEELQSQITAMAEQQATLQAQVDRIDALVNQQVTFGIAATTTFSGWASTTGMDTKAASTIAVPPGYSQALVFALASMHFMDSSPNGGWIRAAIGGEAGGEMGGLANLQLGQSASHTRAMSGVGSPIVIQCQMRSSVATGGMSGRIAQISGFALFFR